MDADSTVDAALSSLLTAIDLKDLNLPGTTLTALLELNATGRPKLLAKLKELGVSRLADRQAVATALSKAARGEDVAPRKRIAPILDQPLAQDVRTFKLGVRTSWCCN